MNVYGKMLEREAPEAPGHSREQCLRAKRGSHMPWMFVAVNLYSCSQGYRDQPFSSKL